MKTFKARVLPVAVVAVGVLSALAGYISGR